MTKYTIIIEDKRLENFVLSFFQSLEKLPNLRLSRNGDSFTLHSAKKKDSQPKPSTAPDISTRFEALYAIWKKETLLSSDGDEITGHPAYRQMIALGRPAVPFMLTKLKEDPHFLFDALTAITGEDPVRDDHAGRLKKMAEDWLNWGRQQGFDTL